MTMEEACLDHITIMDTDMDTGMDMDMGMDTGMGMGMGITPIQTKLEKKSALACFQDFVENLNSI